MSNEYPAIGTAARALPPATPCTRSKTSLPPAWSRRRKRICSYADFLDDLLTLEVGSKSQKHLAMRIAMARFPLS